MSASYCTAGAVLGCITGFQKPLNFNELAHYHRSILFNRTVKVTDKYFNRAVTNHWSRPSCGIFQKN